MRTAAIQFTARLSAMTVSAGALAVLLMAPPARSVDTDTTIEKQQIAHLETLMARHDVRNALDLSRDAEEACATTHQERG